MQPQQLKGLEQNVGYGVNIVSFSIGSRRPAECHSSSLIKAVRLKFNEHYGIEGVRDAIKEAEWECY